jgi:hypothetical protein
MVATKESRPDVGITKVTSIFDCFIRTMSGWQNDTDGRKVNATASVTIAQTTTPRQMISLLIQRI